MTADQILMITDISTHAEARDILTQIYLTSPLEYQTAGYHPAPDGMFGGVARDFPELFPVVNEGPMYFMGRVWRAAPIGYDAAKPTLYGIRYYDLNTIHFIAEIRSKFSGL